MDREAWHAVIHGVTKSRTQLSYWTELTEIDQGHIGMCNNLHSVYYSCINWGLLVVLRFLFFFSLRDSVNKTINISIENTLKIKYGWCSPFNLMLTIKWRKTKPELRLIPASNHVNISVMLDFEDKRRNLSNLSQSGVFI